MRIELAPPTARVDATLHLRRAATAPIGAPIVLDGCGLELRSVAMDGRPVAATEREVDDRRLTIVPPAAASVELAVTAIASIGPPPAGGLFAVDGLIASLCEPISFRTISYGRDRPAERSTYDVTIVADRASCPTLLANGALVDSGTIDGGRHYARFIDPVPKPAYLFACLAGDLRWRSVRHVTFSGREVEIRVVGPPELIDGAGYALEVCDRMMRWDELQTGVEFDLDVLVLGAVPGYPSGANESHGLILFDVPTLLLDPRGSIDDDLAPILANVSHEYAHHVRGNRVGISTWRDLPLKEGLAVLAQHDFRRDQLGAAARLLDIADLRRLQYPEEVALPRAVVQPSDVDPESLYTRTTYLKAKEIFRMLRSAIGVEAWEAAFREVVTGHDLEAIALDDFLDHLHRCAPQHSDALADLAGWFSLVGRPAVMMSSARRDGRVAVTLERTDSIDGPRVAIPIAVAAVTASGTVTDETTLLLTSRRETFELGTLPNDAVVSGWRDASAPVDFATTHSDTELAVLARGEPDPLARRLAIETLMNRWADHGPRRDWETLTALVDAMRATIQRCDDPLLLAHLLAPPDENVLGDRDEALDVDEVHRRLVALRTGIAEALEGDLRELSARATAHRPGSADPRDVALRSLLDVCTGYLVMLGRDADIAALQGLVSSPDNTVAVRSLTELVRHDHIPADEVHEMLVDARRRWARSDQLVDHWVRVQARSWRTDTLERLERLVASGDYRRDRRSRVLALWLPFATQNRSRFHDRSGRGYRLFVDECVALLDTDPHLVERIGGDLVVLPRLDVDRQRLLRHELERLARSNNLPLLATAALRDLLGGRRAGPR